MISLKKSYARHLLQLALTLSLLRVDPENYIGYGWESQLALQNGDGWQLELRAAPLTDFPYSNRKALIPLIEDLVRFDRQTNHSSYDVQTYLLNVQNEQISLSSVPIAPTSTIDTNTSLPMSNHQPAQISNELQQSGNATDFNVPITSDMADLFTINAEQFTDGVSVFEQNLADLNDYGDGNNNNNDRNGARSNDTWNIGQLYAGLPLKDEPPELFDENRFDPLRPFSDIDTEIGALSSASTSNDNSLNRPNNHLYGMLRHTESPTLNLSQVIEWSEYFSNTTKTEPNTDNETIIETTASLNQQNTTEDFKNVRVKLESEGDDDDRNSSDDCKNSTSGFSSNVELTEEESECAEVLYKQDQDMGFALNPVREPSPKESVNISGPSINTEDNEKLKALQDLKNEKSKHEETEPTFDDWPGFPIDNETGECILPLDIDDVFLAGSQVGEVLAECSELNGECSEATASTSNQFDTTKTEEIDNNPSTSDIYDSELQHLLDGEEILNDIRAIIDDQNDLNLDLSLEDLDMIQSAGPFQHPHGRVAQNYSHGNSNMYHRQPSYHSHHHQSRLSFSRAAASMDRLEIANMLGPLPGMGIGVGDMSSYSHYPSHYSYQGASSLPQHDQYGAHQHLSLHNIQTGDMEASQPISIGPLSTQRPHYPTNLGSAVSTSMQITDPSHDSNVLGATSNYKIEHHDTMNFYSNASSELNQTDAIFSQMMGYEELFMDIGPNVNDANVNAYYTNRLLEPNTTNNNSPVLSAQSNAAAAVAGSLNNNGAALLANAAGVAPQMQTTLNGNTATSDRLEASSDSAVSSMGSERVPSLSDGEWCDTGSDSAQEYHHSKYGAYDYSSYNSRMNDAVRHPVAQKKHLLFGKRHLQDQSGPNLNISQSASNAGVVQPQPADMPIKYEYDPYPMHHPIANLDGAAGGMPMNKHQSQQCSIDFGRHNPRGIHDIVGHNHTYTLPQASGATPRSQLRDKKNSKKSEDEHLTRDEKRARTLHVPIAVIDIINLPMDEFNERLSKYDLNENQLSLIRDIRRRGKNKVAAQNCRKRKLDQIMSLAGEVEEVRERKERLIKEQAAALTEQNRIKKKFSELYAHIFQNLRDPQGNPYSQNEYNLQQSADGRVHLLPRDTHNPNQVNLQMQHNAQQQQPNQQQQQQQQPTNSTHHISHHHNPRH